MRKPPAGRPSPPCDRFDFEKLRTDLKQSNINTTNPFSYCEFLKQAFTEGKMWYVDKERLDRLLKKGYINKTQYKIWICALIEDLIWTRVIKI
ncbi:hypothetical protein [Candidatus Kuenenia sp.]|uniref:hypothetical protein n=1 Tax=Candidatus Kuenenia sp. TaxID=2499824 RepID=UPI00322032B4